MNYIYGPVPSRRLGLSLGVSPIPKKTCNYSCVYCQLGRTNLMTNQRQLFYEVNDIITEFKEAIENNKAFDVVTIVGEGEPTLYLGLGELIKELKKLTQKPIAIITNGALLYDAQVRQELNDADIVLPTFDAYNQSSFKTINRPHGSINFHQVFEGLKKFSHEFKGNLWLEMMFIKDLNDSLECVDEYKKLLKEINYDRLYLNTPVRPPAENYIEATLNSNMLKIQKALGGISINLLDSEGFYSNILNHQEAIYSIIKRHPMNQYEIRSFLNTRNCLDIEQEMKLLDDNKQIESIKYKGYITYRLR